MTDNLWLPSPLVDVSWLQKFQHHPQLVLLDASSHMPNSPRNAYQEWLKERIPGAVFFDFNKKICEPKSTLPHMLPSAEKFTQEVQALGINKDSVIIIYDSLGIFSAPRAWWMFTAMGHTQCAILDGGVPAWKSQGGSIDNNPTKPLTSTGNFIAQPQQNYIKNKQQVLSAIHDSTITILDARSQERFDGRESEPRPSLISGHIPSSKSLPFSDLLDGGKFKSIQELKYIFSEKLSSHQHIYASCGSGVTACIIAFAAHLIGYEHIAVYDGSWCEWGDPANQLPIETA